MISWYQHTIRNPTDKNHNLLQLWYQLTFQTLKSYGKPLQQIRNMKISKNEHKKVCWYYRIRKNVSTDLKTAMNLTSLAADSLKNKVTSLFLWSYEKSHALMLLFLAMFKKINKIGLWKTIMETRNAAWSSA